MPDTNTKIVLVIKDEVPEKSTWSYSGKLYKTNGAALTLAELEEFKITIHALDKNETIINNVNQMNAKNENRGAVESDGSFIIETEPNDNVIVDSRKKYEKHRMLLEWTYGGGKSGKRIVEYTVVNLAKIA